MDKHFHWCYHRWVLHWWLIVNNDVDEAVCLVELEEEVGQITSCFDDVCKMVKKRQEKRRMYIDSDRDELL